MTIQVSPAKPAEEVNGLESLHEQLMQTTAKPVVVIAVLQRTKRVLPDSDTEPYPVVRWAQIEPVYDDAADTAMGLLEAARVARTGQATLDMDPTEADAEFDAAAPDNVTGISRAKRGAEDES